LAKIETDTPLEFMLTIMRDVTLPPQVRFEVAKAAAPYIHPKAPEKRPDDQPVHITEIRRIIVDPVRVDDDVPQADEIASGEETRGERAAAGAADLRSR
jgi:hypothetical protein